MSLAYSAIVRSLENLPEPATFRTALRDHSSGSARSRVERGYSPSTVRSAFTSDLREASAVTNNGEAKMQADRRV
jgi:hypothetical protein